MKTFKYIIFLIFCVISLVSFNQSFLIDNGDYHRITKILKIDYPVWTEETRKIFLINDNIIDIPINSTYQLLCKIILKIHLLFNINIINISVVKIFLYLLFTIGNFLLVFKNRNLLYSIILIPISLIYHTIMNSFYQEAIIYALLPLFIYSIKEKLNILFLILSIAIILSKPQMILISFYFLFTIIYSKNSYKIKSFYIIFILITIIFSFKFQSKENQFANKYNRYYNGLGYVTQDVFDWPTKNFNERLVYYSNNKLKLIEKSKKYFDNDFYKFAGSTTYPDLHLLQQKNPLKSKILMYNSKNSNYFKSFINKPILIFKIIQNSFLTSFKSEYSLNYLKNDNKYNFGILKYTYIYFCIILILPIFYYKNFKTLIFSVLNIIILPTFVVIGDGFYELEKHLLTFIILMPFYIKLINMINNTSANIGFAKCGV